MRNRGLHFLIPLILMALSTPGATHLERISTSFEFTEFGPFTIGTSPLSATFTGGAAQTVGVGAYYKSGRFSWHVPPGGSASITFETPAETVEFWFRDTQDAASSRYEIVDTAGAVIASGNGNQFFGLIALGRSTDQTRIASIEFISAGGGDTVVDDFSFSANEDEPTSPLPPQPPTPSDGPVNLTGTVQTASGTPLCAMVLANGKFQFSCGPDGTFSLQGLARDNGGLVKRQVYASGFFPKIDTLQASGDDAVTLERAGSCTGFNAPYEAGENPDSTGDQIDISGQVLLGDSDTPLCALVLANGQFQFSCDGTGNYALNIPLDSKGQFKLQVYAAGFAPNIQLFDEFKRVNDARMARASTCN